MKIFDFHRFWNNNSSETPKTKRQRQRSRVCRVEELESREMLSVSPLEFSAICEQYADLDLSANMADYNIIEIGIGELSAQTLQAALDAAAKTVQDDLIVIRTDNENNTLALYGNPLTIEINSARFGSVAIVVLSDSNTSLTVDTQGMSRAFRINSGNAAMGGMEIVGQTWSFDVNGPYKDYKGLIAVRGQSTLVTSNLRTTAAASPAQAPAADMTAPPLDFGNDALMWERPEAGVWDFGDSMVAGAPYGTTVQDTSEYMVGDVWVTLVLMESTGTKSQLDWTAAQIKNVITQVRQGLDWWETMFDTYNPDSLVLLTFTIDITWAINPVETSYEPVTTKSSNEEHLWIGDFLVARGYKGNYSKTQSHLTDTRDFNHKQRTANDTDWAFTVFVVNSSGSTNSNKFSDGTFAYSWVGGPHLVMTYGNNGWGIGSMGIVLAHEVGHIFWALDEYSGAGKYTDRSGYYNVQNTNAKDGHPNASLRANSIMSESELQRPAYRNLSSSQSSLEMIGWRDSNGNGILDVLDCPLTLTNTNGTYDPLTKSFVFAGTSSITTLTNQNPLQTPASTRHSTTLNTVSHLQYKINDGDWITWDTEYGGTTNVRVGATISLDGITGTFTIFFRTICERTGVTSREESYTIGPVIEPSNNGTAPPAVRREETFSVTGTVKNTGNVISDEYMVTFYALTSPDTPVTSWIELGYVTMPSLGVGGTATAELENIDASLLESGTFYYIAWIVTDMNGQFFTSHHTGCNTAAVFVMSEDGLPPPATPKNLRSTGKTHHSVSLAWDKAADITGYEIRYSQDGGVTWKEDNVAVSGTTATISDLIANTQYEFQVRSVKDESKSAWSVFDKVSVKTNTVPLPLPPVKPAKVKAVPKESTISTVKLTWTANAQNETYEIKIYDSKFKRFLTDTEYETELLRDNGQICGAVISGLNHGKLYKVSVTAKNGSQTSAAVTVLARTAKYTAVRGVKSVKNLTSVTLTWQASTAKKTEGTKETYEIDVYYDLRCTLSVTTARVNIIGTSAVIEGLSPTTKYTFVVKAVTKDAGGKLIETSVARKVRAATSKYTAVTGARVDKKGAESVDLSWTRSKFTETTHYQIVWWDNGVEKTKEFEWTPDPYVLAVFTTISGLSPSKKYTFTIRAFFTDENGKRIESANARVTVTTAPILV